MKKCAAMLLCFLLVMALLPMELHTASADGETSGQCGDNAYWSLDESTGILTISGTGEISNTMGWYDLQDDIRRVVVEDGITYIPGSAFDLLQNLVSAHIGRSVAEIGWNPFAWSLNLQEITVDSNNTSFRVTDGVLFSMDGTELYAYPPQKDGNSYVIPDGVTWIKTNAFCAARKLNSVTIPDSVTIIDGWSFSGSELTSVTIPESVENVWGGAFEECTALETVVIEGSETHFGYTDGYEGSGAFTNCINLRSLTIPCDQWPYEHTFTGCYSLEELHLTVGSGEINTYMIEDLLFWYRKYESWIWDEETESWEVGELPDANPLSVILDEGITSVPEGTFDTNYFDDDDYDSDSAIASVTLPASITEIGENAFAHCGNLTDVYYGSTEDQKDNIDIAAGNEDLLNATWHYLPIAFKTQSLTLEGKIGVDFFVELPQDDAIEYEGVAFTIDSIDGATAFVPFGGEGHPTNGSGYYKFTYYVRTIEMADTITATLRYTLNGEDRTLEKTYSVKQYFDTFDQYISLFSEKQQNMTKATADLGHYVQAFLAAQKGWTFGTDYAEMDKHYADYTSADISAAQTALTAYAPDKSLGTNMQKITYSLVLDSDTELLVYFKPAADYTGTLAFTVNGNPIAEDGEKISVKLQSDGRYLVSIKNIGAHELSNAYEIKALSDGDEATITVSALSYANAMMNAYTGNTTALNAAVALYRYAMAAEAMQN